ncbi:H-NS family nucleoid-associated regulatory protein [Uliginosibacterium sediminicola]
MELNKLSLTELNRLKSRVEAEIARRADTSKRDLLKKVQKLAADAGVSLDDLLGQAPAKAAGKTAAKAAPKAAKKPGARKGQKVAPKYSNPADASQTWTGRGRQPAWVAAHVAAGNTLDSLLIL